MGARCCASAAVHVAELARIAAATVTMRTPARDTPVGLRIGRSRQGRFIANSYCTASSPPHITYGCPGSALVAYLPCLARSCRNSGHKRRAAEKRDELAPLHHKRGDVAVAHYIY